MDTAEKLRRYCEYQDRSEQEVRRKMAQLLVPNEERDNLMEQLKNERFVDDERFAESFIRGKMNQKRWGRVKIQAELRLHGVSTAIISEKMALMDEERYFENLRYLADKWQRETHDNDRTKLIRHLLSKGYTMDEISQIK